MSDSATAKRAFLVAAGSMVALGSASQAASADAFDGRHLSANQGASCAVRVLALAGDNVLHHGRLPRAFNNFRTGRQTDGIAGLCRVIDEKSAEDKRQGPLGLLGGLPVRGNPAGAVRDLPVGATPLGHRS